MVNLEEEGKSKVQNLLPWELRVLELFVRAANLIGLPRSVGEIYGCLFCAQKPTSFDALMSRLKISKGSVSQGLKVLRQLGAVKVLYIPGSRKDHYVAEFSMKQLVHGFIRDQLKPHLESGTGRLAEVEILIDQIDEDATQRHAKERIQVLKNWQARLVKVLPLVVSAMSGMDFLSRGENKSEEII